MIATQRYWFSKLFGNKVSPIIDNDIGTATNMAGNKDKTAALIALNTDLFIQAAGTKTIKVMNQPAPKGNGKYSVQNEFGTVFENRNWSGKATTASPKRIPLHSIASFSSCTVPSMYRNLTVGSAPEALWNHGALIINFDKDMATKKPNIVAIISYMSK